MSEVKIYRCNHCGNMFVVVNDGKGTPQCCGEAMELLQAGTSDGAAEKHVPFITAEESGVKVAVGEVEHPMVEEHFIQWVARATDSEFHLKYLKPGEAPEVHFDANEGDVYEYCNLHGLWKAEI